MEAAAAKLSGEENFANDFIEQNISQWRIVCADK